MPKSVAVIGAGACGLAALKELLAVGLDVTTYEASDKIGGVFSHIQPHYNLTITNHMMAFSDFPFHQPIMYSFLKDYLDYLYLYVQKFGLDKYINFNHKVVKVTEDKMGKWVLDIEKTDAKGMVSKFTKVYDALVVGSGAHLQQNLPDLTGFTGEVIHSQDWDAKKQGIKEKKQRVLLIGVGESSADTINDCTYLASTTYVYSRRTPILAPRLLGYAEKECSTGKVYPLFSYLECGTTSRASNGTTLRAATNYRKSHWSAWSKDPTHPSRQLSAWMYQIALDNPNKCEYAGFATKNQKLAECVQDKRAELIIASNVSYNGKKATFSNGRSIEIDAIVLNTGFNLKFPFLDEIDIKQCPRSWFKHSIPPKYGNKLAFVGFGRPHQGGIPAVGEMQSRYIALVFSGQRTLPANYAQLAKEEGEFENAFYEITPHLKTLCDYPSMMNSLSRLIGCEPSLPAHVKAVSYGAAISAALTAAAAFNVSIPSETLSALPAVVADFLPKIIAQTNILPLAALTAALIIGQFVMDDFFFVKYLCYPDWGCWYRLNGPGKNPAVLYEVLGRFPFLEQYAPLLPTLIKLVAYGKIASSIGWIVKTITFGAVGGDILYWGTPKNRILHGASHRAVDSFSFM